MTPRPANRRNRAVTMDPKSLTLAQLNAPPRNSLILLASARNLVTTGTRSRLAQRIFEHEHANSHTPQAIAPNLPASTENPGVSEDLERPSRSTGRQQPSSTPGSQFSPDKLSQLRELIAETVSSQRSGPGEASGLLADVPLLSPASPLNITATTATEQNLNGINLPNVIQDGGLSLRQLVPSLPQTSQGPAQQIVTNQAYEHHFTLPPLPEKLRSKISKREYIDFNELLSDNMYPHPSFASSQNNFTLTVDPQDATTLAFVPSQHKKRRIDGLSSWLEAWNVFLRSTISIYPSLAPDLLTYQVQICKFSRKFKASAWLVYCTAFRYMAALHVAMSWGKVNEQLYNDILKEETLPYCVHCHNYGHRTLGCPTRSKPVQPFRPFSSSTTTPSPDTFGPASNTPLPSRNEHPQQAAICRDFNRRACRRPNCHFKHICNKPDCGGNHPGSQCPKVPQL